MKKSLLFICVLSVLASLPGNMICVSAENEINIYVSCTGSDIYGKGTFRNPYKTVEKASAKTKELLRTGTQKDIDVIFRSGEYTLSETINYNYISLRGYNGKITYKAYRDEYVTFSGADNDNEWISCTNGIYKTACGEKINSVYEGENTSVKARYPNRGEKRSDGYLAAAADGTDRTIYFNTGDIPFVQNQADLQAYLFAGGPGFVYALDNPGAYIDYANNTITLNNSATNNVQVRAGSRYYMQGAPEFLDEPGEMYYSSTEKCVYYMPYDEQEIENVYVPKLKTAVFIEGRSEAPVGGISFEGIEFKHFDAENSEAGCAIRIEHANNIEITDCCIKNCASGAIMARYTRDSRFSGNRIENIGGGAVFLMYSEQEANYGGNVVNDNYINNIGLYEADSSGISITATSENKILHNRISKTPRSAINFGSGQCQVWAKLGTVVDGVTLTRDNMKPYLVCNDNLIQYNDCSEAMLETNDGGVIYSWGAGYDNDVSFNYIHNSNQEFSFGWVLYMDDDTSRTTLTHNFIENCGSSGGDMQDIVMIKGQDNLFENNLLANCKSENGIARIDSQSGAGPVGNAIYRKNIIYNCGNSMFSFYSYQVGAADENRKFRECDDNVYYDKNGNQFYIKIRNNADEYVKAADMEEWQEIYSNDVNSAFRFPGFCDIYSGDYRLTLNGEAKRRAIESLDFGSMGIEKEHKFIQGSQMEGVYITAGGSPEGEIYVKTGETLDLKSFVRDENGIPVTGVKTEYYSSDPEVVCVEGNRLMAKAKGSAKVTLIASQGSKALANEIYLYVY